VHGQHLLGFRVRRPEPERAAELGHLAPGAAREVPFAGELVLGDRRQPAAPVSRTCIPTHSGTPAVSTWPTRAPTCAPCRTTLDIAIPGTPSATRGSRAGGLRGFGSDRSPMGHAR
jgi:hypothetical protein